MTQEQFKQALRILKRTMDRVDSIDKKTSGVSAAAEGEVNLDTVETAPAGMSAESARPSPHHGGSSVAPNLKVYFDLNLVNRPGIPGQELAFMNFHSFVFLEFLPNSKLQFSLDLPDFNYYELDYQVTPKLQVRAGRIWIPFDDLSPHSLFGGRVNVSALSPNGQTFLPTLWTDLGLGLKYQLVDTQSLTLVSHVYVVNGFGDGGTDPMGGSAGYPQYSSTQGSQDGNRGKAIGGRLHATLNGMFGIGVSHYSGRWNAQDETVGRSVKLYGMDAQVRFDRIELRSGIASGQAEIEADVQGNTTAKRGGLYGEIGVKLGEKKLWKILGRGGNVQLDNRVISANDQQLVGATLLRRLGPMEVSIEHSRDVKKVATKTNYSLTNLRLIIAL